MTSTFGTIRNHFEDLVYGEVTAIAHHYPHLKGNPDLLADVACVALNNLPPRYIRHAIDLSFYMTERERAKCEASVRTAVESAFDFVSSRTSRRSRA